ncbi:MAG: hypothetical protein L3J73_03560 [Thermoplasmata archaeon]|nr:hypothetical protein [Thermoplasmata archaeon]
MGARLWAAGIGLALLGGYLLVAPIDVAPVTSLSVPSGEWAQVTIPSTASLAGAPIYVALSWGYPVGCGASWFGYGRPCAVPDPSYLTIYDCGRSECTVGVDYPQVGFTDAAVGGLADLPVVPGHRYQVWAWDEYNRSANLTIPFEYQLRAPLLGGVVGLALVGSGVAILLVAVRRTRPRRRGRTPQEPAIDAGDAYP